MSASMGASATWPSSKEKFPSRHDIISNTTSSTWMRTWRSSSFRESAPASTRIAPSWRLSPSRRCCSRSRVRSPSVIFPARSRSSPNRCGLLRMPAEITAPRSKYTVPCVVAEHGRDRELPRLPAQVEQLEDIVDAEFAERAFDRHQLASCRWRKMRSRSPRGPRLAARAARELPVGFQLHHAVPLLDRLPVTVLVGEQHAVEEERAHVAGIEAEHALDRDRRVARALEFEQRLGEREERVHVVRIAAQQVHEGRHRVLGAAESAPHLRQRERRLHVRGHGIQRGEQFRLGPGAIPLLGEQAAELEMHHRHIRIEVERVLVRRDRSFHVARGARHVAELPQHVGARGRQAPRALQAARAPRRGRPHPRARPPPAAAIPRCSRRR